MHTLIKYFRERRYYILFYLVLCVTPSCTDFLQVDSPSSQVDSNNVFVDDPIADAAMSGVYSSMMEDGFASGSFGSITLMAGLSADELIMTSSESSLAGLLKNSLTANDQSIEATWNKVYQIIYYTNSILEGVNNSNGLDSDVRHQLEGETKFVRAFCHFYLVNLFGDVPLVLTTNYQTNNSASRTLTADVCEQIIRDLKDAQALLPVDYSRWQDERIRANKWAATALLARVYLYLGDWANANLEATRVIESSLYRLEADLNTVFLKNSTEAIWQLRPVEPGINTHQAYLFIPTETLPSVRLTESVVDLFGAEDDRLEKWVISAQDLGNTYHFPYKYKVIFDPNLQEYSMVLRLAEQYLIRAEARAEQNNLEEAIEDLDVIRVRAGLSPLANTPISQDELLHLIYQERRIELFAEWGHRWFDLKRTGRATEVLSPVKAPNWEPTDVFYPIPQSERDRNARLHQNEGY